MITKTTGINKFATKAADSWEVKSSVGAEVVGILRAFGLPQVSTVSRVLQRRESSIIPRSLLNGGKVFKVSIGFIPNFPEELNSLPMQSTGNSGHALFLPGVTSLSTPRRYVCCSSWSPFSGTDLAQKQENHPRHEKKSFPFLTE